VLGFPADSGDPKQRAARVAAAILLYFALNSLVSWGIEATGAENTPLVVFPAAALTFGGTILGGVALGRHLGWYPAADAGTPFGRAA
jgi:hypothetical protein